MKDDPAIERVRDARRRVSATYDNDPQKIVSHYIELQKKYQARILEEQEETATYDEPIEV